jgi:serine/threonine protein phosphatase 1
MTGGKRSVVRRPAAIRPTLSAGKQHPSVPAGTRIYAIGDVHGRADLLISLFERIDADLIADPIERPIQVFLGDYIDRGPASREVIERLIARKASHETVCLKGNHETFALEFLDDPGVLEDWRRWGGLETLLSYGVVSPGFSGLTDLDRLCTALNRAMPAEHVGFLANLETTYECGDYFFVHAGVRPGVKLWSQREQDLIWIREEFLSAEADFGKVIVHGHTPVREPEIRPNRINIDTGAYITGNLTCLVIEGEKLFFI